MKTAFHPFRRPTVNPDATGKLDAAMAYLESRGGFPEGVNLAEFARQWQVEPRSLRWRCTRAGIATPAAMAQAGAVARAEGGIYGGAMAPAGSPTVAEVDRGNPEAGAEGGQATGKQCITVEGESESGEKVQSAYNLQSVCTLEHTNLAPVTGIDRSQIPVLQETEVDRHDAEVARLVRDSLDAFRKGKSKGPGGRRVIPIQKVSDLTALDTLFRRATRQGERTGGETSRPILNIQFLGSASRESVRVAKDETSRIIDVAGEEAET